MLGLCDDAAMGRSWARGRVETGSKGARRLARREEEGPLARVVLGEDGDHALYRPEHGAVDHHWPLVAVAALGAAVALDGAALVLEIESHRLHEVELHRGALVGALERIEHLRRLGRSR